MGRAARKPADKPMDPVALREYVLETIDQLAVLAVEQDDVSLARTLWACWGQLNPDMAELAPQREIVWIDTPETADAPPK